MRVLHKAIASVSMIILSAAAAFSIRQLHRYRKAKSSADGPLPDMQTPSNHEVPPADAGLEEPQPLPELEVIPPMSSDTPDVSPASADDKTGDIPYNNVVEAETSVRPDTEQED